MIYTVKKESTLFEFICQVYQGISNQSAKNIIKHAEFRIDGKLIRAKASILVKEGSKIEINRDKSIVNTKDHPDKRSPIVFKYEDQHIIVAIKPAGIATNKNNEGLDPSFHKKVEEFLTKRERKNTRLWLVHRIDKEVEGLLLFAKSEEIQEQIKENWHDFTKKYMALCLAKPEKKQGKIESWLHDTSSLIVKSTPFETEGSKFAISEYHYIKPIGKYHLIEIKLHTGRKNQIRVHLSEIGCPIVGDKKYGDNSPYKRQIRLVAYYLEIHHPVNGNKMTFEYIPSAKFYHPAENKNENYKLF